MQFPKSTPSRRSNEDVFFAYYPHLSEWALQITRNEWAEAEDLVQEFYLLVTRLTRPLDEKSNLDQYLFRVLRNLYRAQLRRARREPIDNLSIVDYDSVEQGLAATDRRQLLLARARLEEICLYACQRKSANRSAGILIMRFFHGYFPSELMRIVQVPRYVVDQALYVVRSEARAWSERPGAVVSILDGKPEGKQVHSSLVHSPLLFEDSEDLFLKLRKLIFSASEGDCFGRPALESRYADSGKPSPLTAQDLSHLVSCPVCLDQVNTILRLPLLSERSPENGLDRDGTSGPSGGSGDSGSIGEPRPKESRGSKDSMPKKAPSREALERRAQAIYEHRPQILEIVVDGDPRSSQMITAEYNELRATLSSSEEPSFIEVLSEQGVRMAALLVDPPDSADKLEQAEAVELSDDRSLALSIHFASEGSVIRVVYRDPVMAAALLVENLNPNLDPKLAPAMALKPDFAAKELPQKPADTDGYKLLQRPAASAAPAPAALQSNNPLHRWAGAVSGWVKDRVKGHLNPFRVPNMTPLLATGIVCAVFSIVFFFLAYRSTSVMNPADMLKRSATAELAPLHADASGVIVQTVRIQTPQRKVERTLYRDVQGKRRLKDSKLGREDASLRGELETLGVLWNDPLSAGSFRDWHDHADVQRDVVKRPEKGLLTLTTTVAEGSIASESLTVREADFHPIRRTVELRNAGTVEIAELNYSVLPWASVNPDLFEPVSDAGPVVGRSGRSAILPRLSQTLSDIEIDEAELGARLVLSRLHLDGSDRLQVIRQPMGAEVLGVVTDAAEKRLLQTQLYMVPHVTASVMTIQEMAARPTAASDVTSIRQSSAATHSEPSALEKYFESQGMDRTAASASVHEFVESSFVVNRESEQISDLLYRFASSDRLSGAARAELSELLSQHKAALLDALGREERQLAALQLVSQSAIAAANSSSSADDLRGIGQYNRSLCAELTSESTPSSRSAQQIAQQLRDSIAQVRAVALRISTADQLHSPSYARYATSPENR